MSCISESTFHFHGWAWEYYAIAWLAPVGLALMLRGFGRWSWARSLGLAIMTVPLWFTATRFIASIPVLLCTGGKLFPYTPDQLSSITSDKLLSDLGYVVVGALVYVSDWKTNPLTDLGFRTMARRLRDAGLPTGRSERHSAFLGLVAFPAIWYATFLASLLVNRVSALNQNDEALIWDNMSIYHAVLLAAAAAFGEELLYRGVLQTLLDKAFRKRMGPTAAAALAIGSQSVLFGLAHAGYGTYSHILGPLFFGLVVGVAARYLGLWAAIVMHFLIDLVIWLAVIAQKEPVLAAVLGVRVGFAETLSILLMANVVLTLSWTAWQIWKRMRLPKPAPPAF